MKIQIEIYLFIPLIIFLFIFGWMSNTKYHEKTNPVEDVNKRVYNGLSFYTDRTRAQAIETAKKYENTGHWVCVNVKGMPYDKCVEVSQHECGHEIFAEILEKHPEKINEIMKVAENGS